MATDDAGIGNDSAFFFLLCYFFLLLYRFLFSFVVSSARLASRPGPRAVAGRGVPRCLRCCIVLGFIST